MAKLQRSLVLIGEIPTPSGLQIREFDHNDPLGAWLAFEQIDGAAAHDKASAEPGDAGPGKWPILLVGGSVCDLDLRDYIGSRGLLRLQLGWAAARRTSVLGS